MDIPGWAFVALIAGVVVISFVIARPDSESRLMVAESLRTEADAQLRNGEAERAFETIRRARRTVDDPVLAYNEALTATHLNRTRDAEAAARAATKGEPSVAEHAYVFLSILADRRGDVDERDRVLEEGLRRLPESPFLLERHAFALFERGDEERAERVVVQLENAGGSSLARATRAEWKMWALAEQGRLEEALTEIDEALADGAMSWRFVATTSALLCRAGRAADALSLLDRVDWMFAPSPELIRNRVWALCLLERVDDAVRLAESSPEASDDLSPDARAIADETRAIAYIYARDDRAEPHPRLLMDVEGDDEDFQRLLDEPSPDGRTWRKRLLSKADR